MFCPYPFKYQAFGTMSIVISVGWRGAGDGDKVRRMTSKYWVMAKAKDGITLDDNDAGGGGRKLKCCTGRQSA